MVPMGSEDALSEWTSRDVIEAIVLCRAKWRAELPAIHEEALYYVSIARLGHQLCAAVLGGCRKPWVGEVFAAIERGLERGDSEAKNLLVVGLFESMQGDSYRHGPPDLFERLLGPLGRAAWADLIEGWTGEGVRTVEHWRRVIRNGDLAQARWSHQGGWREVRLDGGHALARSPAGERALTDDERERFLAHFRPWVATALGRRPRVEPTFTDEIELRGPYDARTVRVAGGLGTDGQRWFSVDLSAIPWPET